LANKYILVQTVKFSPTKWFGKYLIGLISSNLQCSFWWYSLTFYSRLFWLF